MAQDLTPSYSQFACIGSGLSAIALGATLKRWHGIVDIRFFERHADLGGTWFVNQYPGCACDVPSLLYSLSFAPNKAWSKALPSRNELWEYIDGVAVQYGLREKMTFNATVEKCQWIEQRHRWRLFVRGGEANNVFVHESQFLFSGSGILVHPRKPDLPGIESFGGPVFHASRWQHDVDLRDKDVVVVGNGCTASQIMPAIQGKTRHVTQFVRSKHWIVPTAEVPNTGAFRFLCKHVPGFLAAARFVVFCIMENELRAFYMNEAATAHRRRVQAGIERYMRKTAPEKYHDLLMPEFEVGCKRRISDSGYLRGLHADNVTLTNDPIVEVAPDGVRSEKAFTKADVIVLANGYETNAYLAGIEVVGRDGVTAAQHWESLGGPGAYNSTSLSGFPNFFMLLGPNTATGHTSTLLATENAVNYSLRIIKPVLEGEAAAVDVRREAEERYVAQIQRDLKGTVWSSGCGAWYSRESRDGARRNAMTYPYWQPYMWYQCLFPAYRDFAYEPMRRPAASPPRRGWRRLLGPIAWAGILVSAAGAWAAGRRKDWSSEAKLLA